MRRPTKDPRDILLDSALVIMLMILFYMLTCYYFSLCIIDTKVI